MVRLRQTRTVANHEASHMCASMARWMAVAWLLAVPSVMSRSNMALKDRWEASPGSKSSESDGEAMESATDEASQIYRTAASHYFGDVVELGDREKLPKDFESKLESYKPKDTDVGVSIRTLVEEKGYPFEEYTCETKDGYLLTMHRIPHGREGAQTSEMRPPLLLKHGVLDSSYTWVANSANQSLGFLAADAGYDVWMGNNRGNSFSEKHVRVHPSTNAFWDFSFHEMGKFDLPAEISCLLRYIDAAPEQKVAIVAHSQGTSQTLAALSLDEDEELAEKVSTVVLLAPVAFLGHAGSPMLEFYAKATSDDELFQMLGRRSFMHSTSFLKVAFPMMCEESPEKCVRTLWEMVSVPDREWKYNFDPTYNINTTRLPVYASFVPAGISTKALVHFAQLMRTLDQTGLSKFQQFDYGPEKNLFMYGASSPPEYNLSRISTPIAIFSGERDALGNNQDVNTLAEILKGSGNLVGAWRLPHVRHCDFIWGSEGYTKVYPTALEILDKYTRSPVLAVSGT